MRNLPIVLLLLLFAGCGYEDMTLEETLAEIEPQPAGTPQELADYLSEQCGTNRPDIVDFTKAILMPEDMTQARQTLEVYVKAPALLAEIRNPQIDILPKGSDDYLYGPPPLVEPTVVNGYHFGVVQEPEGRLIIRGNPGPTVSFRYASRDGRYGLVGRYVDDLTDQEAAAESFTILIAASEQIAEAEPVRLHGHVVAESYGKNITQYFEKFGEAVEIKANASTLEKVVIEPMDPAIPVKISVRNEDGLVAEKTFKDLTTRQVWMLGEDADS